MYTGDKLIFGVQLSVEDAVKYISKYLKSNYKELFDDELDIEMLKDEYGSKREKVYHLIEVLRKTNLTIELDKPPCCLFEDKYDDEFSLIYLGKTLCHNNITYRSSLFDFKTFDDYIKFYTESVNKARELLENNKETYIKEIGYILPKKLAKPKFYSMPNDCYSCT